MNELIKYIVDILTIVIPVGFSLFLFSTNTRSKLRNLTGIKLPSSVGNSGDVKATIAANNHPMNESMISTTSLNFYEDVLKD